MQGLEEVLAAELESLGARSVRPLRRAVAFQGDRELLYRANLQLRTALRILRPVYRFRAASTDSLYHKTCTFDWSAYLGPDQTFAIDAVVYSAHFRHSKYAALKVKDAIVDQLRKKYGRRPSVDTRSPDLRLNLHISEREVTLALDASGDSLHKRGYRQEGHKAPLNEVLAAGLVFLSGWDGSRPLVDPMCGSGTIVVEAAMLASHIPPGILRQRFGFMGWKDYDPALWDHIRQEAREAIQQPDLRILGSDIARRAVDMARQAAQVIGADRHIRFKQSSIKDLEPPWPDGVLIMNPPYGERMQDRDLHNLYSMIGERLKHHFTGYEAWVFAPSGPAMSQIGLRPERKIPLFNGAIECSYRKFALYTGSRKKSKSPAGSE